MESKFFLLETGDIIFSANPSNSFSFFQYDGISVGTFDTLSNQHSPFLYNKKIVGLQDYNGNEKWKSTSTELNRYFEEWDYIQSIFSFIQGKLLVVKLKNKGEIYLIDTNTKTKKVLFNNTYALHHVEYSEEHRFIIINFDDKLFRVDLETDSIDLKITTSGSQKLNPYIWKDSVYFSSNHDSEYFRIYAIDAMKTTFSPKLVYYSENDVRLPKILEDDLFFIEVKNGEYLLKKKNLKTSKIQNITNKGVVYNYTLHKDQYIYYIYSDFNTPKSLYVYDTKHRTTNNITGKSVIADLSYQYINGDAAKSSAYEYFPDSKKDIKGVILHFRPGLHSDFSPRWDPVLNNLVNNGYVVISPNYPMSSGFGKTYYNASFKDAVDDMERWVNDLKNRFKNMPFYCLSSSSGNILMEQVLSKVEEKVDAAVSMFGIPAFDNPSPMVPTLYILGENDPIIEFVETSKKLNSASNNNVRLVSYKNEGHWFRNQNNIENSVTEIIKHFCRFGDI
ncbi:dienelactone hydrolase family protein [Algoriphagus sp. Y33]|uniref:dienelactone hydrolase family protein n=1 Tax=Algoriphagus sp. Y33 TaxID=2772483 RepID=UPI0017815360|nr:dienelactone hydrolase family protein [Algoriphagus sp. Y33]